MLDREFDALSAGIGGKGADAGAYLRAMSLKRLRFHLHGFLDRELYGDPEGAWTPVALELKHAFTVGNARVTAVIDRVDERGGGILVVDYKRSDRDLSPAVKENKKDRGESAGKDYANLGVSSFQLPMYAIAYEKAVGEKFKHIAGQYRVYMSPYKRVPGATAELTRNVLDKTLKNAAALVGKAESGVFPVQPRDPNKCEYCDYRLACRYPEGASWKEEEETDEES